MSAFSDQYGRRVGPDDIGRVYVEDGSAMQVTAYDARTDTFSARSIHPAPKRVTVDLGALAPLLTYGQGVLHGALAVEVAILCAVVVMAVLFGGPS